MGPSEQAWRLLKGEYEDIPKEEHRNYYAGSLNALPGHKPGCDLRLNGYYPHYSASKYSGKCTCEAQCANCGAKEKWGYPYNDTDLCFDCTENMAGQGVINHPLINWMHSQPGGMPSPKTDDEDWRSNIETGEPMDLAWRLLKMPLYHGTTRERAEQIMREGLKPTSHAPQLFEMEPEEIRAAMIEAGRDPADYERLFGGDWNFAYGDQSGREPAISDAALYGGDDPAVIEIDENHPDAPQFMLEPYYPEIEDSELDFFHDPLSQGFNRLKNQMRSNQIVPPSAMRVLQPEEIPPSQLDLLKAPVYTDDNPPPMQQSHHYKMLPYLDQMGGYMWQSEDGMARGTMRPDYFLNSLLINNFEMAGPVRGQNKSRQYIQDMIDQGHEHFEHELDGTHVTNVENRAAGYWNKLVDEGIIDGAHERPNIRTNLDGDQHFIYAYDKETKQPWGHELSEDYADYHDLPTDAVYDNI